MTAIGPTELAERENGYRQCYNDVLLILITQLALNPERKQMLNEILDEMIETQAIRELSNWTHPEDVLKQPL